MSSFSSPELPMVTSLAAQPPASDPCSQLVHILMCYHQGGEDPEFIRKAIESLVKKLKDRREQLDALISAVTSGGKQNTCCVTIHRSLDGRLQVAGRKGIPNVVYARIWRWPKVNKTELVKLPLCSTSSAHPDLICINPYHYDRIVSTGLPNLELSSPFRMESLPSTSAKQQVFNVETEDLEFNSTSAPKSEYLSQQPLDQPYHVLSHLPCGNIINTGSDFPPPPHGQHDWNSSQASMFDRSQLQTHCTLIDPPKHWCSITYFELDTQVGETFKAPWAMADLHIDGGMDPAGAEAGRFCLGALSNVHRSEASERARFHIGKGVRLTMERDGGAVFLECLSQKGVFVRSHFLDFQHGLQHGSVVHKFCSGAHRKIFDLGWAYAEMCEQKQNAHLAAMVQAYAVAGIASQLGTPKAGTGVDDLRRACCTIALSFVKGWGAGYARTNIKETPCWVEIQLHRPLQLLNELLSMT